MKESTKFIIWTIVWFTLTMINDVFEFYSMGGYDRWVLFQDKFYGEEVLGYAALTNLILWIVLYFIFIKKK